MEKVNLTRKQAEALQDMSAKGALKSEIVERHVHKDHIEVNNWVEVSNLSTETLIIALYIGYEIEKTKEERAIAWLIKKDCIVPGISEHDIVMGIKSILEGGGTE